MHPYEVMLMLDADADEAGQNEVIERMRQIVEGGGGTFETVDAWGRLKLAYEIDHKGEAFYHIVNFTSSTETLDEVTRVLRITDERDAPHGRPPHRPLARQAGRGSGARVVNVALCHAVCAGSPIRLASLRVRSYTHEHLFVDELRRARRWRISTASRSPGT